MMDGGTRCAVPPYGLIDGGTRCAVPPYGCDVGRNAAGGSAGFHYSAASTTCRAASIAAT